MICRIHNPTAIVMALVIVFTFFTAIASAENITVDRFDDSATATACLPRTTNDCSLRGAIIRANGNNEDDTIWIPMEGTYILSLGGTGDARGDLDIHADLTIEGLSRHTVLIEASGIHGGDRVFEIHHGVTATIREVWITDSDPANITHSGAGIRNNGNLFLERVQISGIGTTGSGGAIFNVEFFGWLELRGCTIFENHASHSGAGISNWGTLRVFDSTIRSNTAYIGGGGIFNEFTGDVLLTRSTLAANTASEFGGAIYNRGSMNAVNSTFTHNEAFAYSGGGVYNTAHLDLTNVTFHENYSAGATAISSPDGSQVNVVNTLIGGSCSSNPTAFTSLGGNTESPGFTCNLDHPTDLVVPDLMLGSYSYDGGLTPSYSLPQSSLAIDSGIDPLCPVEDQRGHPRPIDGDGDQIARCDRGSYEFNPAEIFLDGFEDTLIRWSTVVGL